MALVKTTSNKLTTITRNEDWASVLIGFLLIGIILFVYKPAVVKFSWNSAQTFLATATHSVSLMNFLSVTLLLLGVTALLRIVNNENIQSFIAGFIVLSLLSYISLVLTANEALKYWGLEYVIFSLLLGIIFRTIFGLPAFLKEAVNSEFYTKTGLVILGTGIIFADILQAGALGLAQAVIVVLCVWYFAFWVSKKMRLDDELSAMIASAVSICGVSAAIAACGAIKGDSKKLSYVVSLVLIVAVPMLVVMPMLANAMHLSPAVGGAWLGGTIDTTGAVVASGALLGEDALKTCTIVKFSQNVLLGVAALLLSVSWTLKKQPGKKVDYHVIWERFPKFVLGFLAASLLFSFVLQPETVKAGKDSFKFVQTLWFSLAFVCIGLETNFRDLFRMEDGRPLMAFLTAQTFNIIITLAIALLLFGGILFAVPVFTK
ncbi:putative sulfate exporter family transporter [Rhodocytophaga rosea]|uniref:Putative sulfate exporter family transporter n=1 Tax=Rhodocytophaga rosea TaxID=2704465 RepID=A0A6C0GW40_9BACT|nr:putative sulfate exporter family transporter [Rhodocytophaga rosea]QHT71552.1 putative sulfate exporter family transporter [Rhodocytophaga rosea]